MGLICWAGTSCMKRFMLGEEDVRMLETIAANARRVPHCVHGLECEVEYQSHPRIKFLMCRQCWGKEEYVRVDDSTAHVIRPNQLGAVKAECLECRSAMDACGCAAAS